MHTIKAVESPLASCAGVASLPRKGEDWRFELTQGGMQVALVTSPDFTDAWREIAHYAAMYSQDGPVEIALLRNGRRIVQAIAPHVPKP